MMSPMGRGKLVFLALEEFKKLEDNTLAEWERTRIKDNIELLAKLIEACRD